MCLFYNMIINFNNIYRVFQGYFFIYSLFSIISCFSTIFLSNYSDDTDRMIESDPRIVLRPLNTPAIEET